MMLLRLQHIDREVCNRGEILKTGGLPGETPKHKRWIEGNRRKRVHRYAEITAITGSGSHHGYARGKLAQGAAKVAAIKSLSYGLRFLLHELISLGGIHEPWEQR